MQGADKGEVLRVNRVVRIGIAGQEDVQAIGADGPSLGLDQRDEVGQMAAALDTSTQRLGEVMAQIVGNATTLAASSEELTAVATQMSAGSEESAAQAQVVSAATSKAGLAASGA